MAAVLLGVGLFGGVLAGLLGVGGGIVIVPVLYHLLDLLDVDSDVAMKLAVGTSLATIIPTSIVSMRSHLRKDAVDVALLKSWGPAIAIGVVIGAVLIGIVEGEVMIGVFAVTAAVVAIHMAFAPEGLRLAEHLPRGVPRFGIGMVIGVISTMMGIGGGTLTVPTLVLATIRSAARSVRRRPSALSSPFPAPSEPSSAAGVRMSCRPGRWAMST